MATFPLMLRHWQEQIQRERIRQHLEHHDNPTPAPTAKRPAGDPHALRGIPVVGVKGGIGGAIPGTRT